MFSLIWRFFPGPVWVRIVLILAAIAALVYVLVFYAYPWAAQYIDTEDDISTVGT